MRLLALDPANVDALTRTGRCHETAGHFALAAAQYEAALKLRPNNEIARSRLGAIRPSVLFPTVDISCLLSSAPKTVFDGFQPADFAELGVCPSNDAVNSRFVGRFDALGQSLNGGVFAKKLQALRGAATTPLFWRGAIWGAPGHVYTYHHGGRWDAQANIGVFSATHWPDSRVRIGIGFNFTRNGRDPHPEEGQKKVLAAFGRLKAALRGQLGVCAREWAQDGRASVDLGHREREFASVPALEGMPRVAACSDELAIEWLFFGKWLRWSVPQDADILGNPITFVRYADSTFRDLLPFFAASQP